MFIKILIIIELYLSVAFYIATFALEYGHNVSSNWQLLSVSAASQVTDLNLLKAEQKKRPAKARVFQVALIDFHQSSTAPFVCDRMANPRWHPNHAACPPSVLTSWNDPIPWVWHHPRLSLVSLLVAVGWYSRLQVVTNFHVHNFLWFLKVNELLKVH